MRQAAWYCRLLIQLGCATGFRIRELLALRVSHVWDGQDVVHEITVPRRLMKGGSGVHQRRVRGRRVALSEAVRAAIRDYLQVIGTTHPERAVFSTGKARGEPMDPSQAFRIIVGAAAACGIDAARISTHSCRKTFAHRVWIASGRDLVVTQRLLGHASPVVTAQYLETDADDLDQLVRGLAA